MVSTQPVLSLKYFQFRKNKLPKGIKKLFYLSWEDALWDILIHKKVKRGSAILIPDFYCSDVEENIKKHGYEVFYYRILSNLEADKKSFVSAIKKYKPSLVVVFHPVGIESNLFNNKKWLAKTVGNSILIEDSVHRVLSSRDIKIIKNNHFIIDSLRKVLPLQGSRIFGKSQDLDFDQPGFFQSLFYKVKVCFYWVLMITCWTLGFGKKGEKYMLKGYDLIGDALSSSTGGIVAGILSERIDALKIQSIKVKQANYYEKCLQEVLPVKLSIKSSDKKYLRGFPIILPIKKSHSVLGYLRNRGLLLRFELDGCAWSNKQKIIYLPMGLQINLRQQNLICELVKSALRIT